MTAETSNEEEQGLLEILEQNWPPEEAVARQEAHGNDKETCRLFGGYVLDAVRTAYGPNQRITRAMLRLASEHGFCPSETTILRNFGGTLWRLNEELGSAAKYARGRYTDDQLMEVGSRNILRYGIEKPDEAFFERLFREGQGPSVGLLELRFGGVGKYLDKIGFINTRQMTKEDYRVWGADVQASGMGLALTAGNIRFMAKRRRGPSDKATMKNYGSISDLQRDTEELASSYTEEQIDNASKRFGVYCLVLCDDSGKKTKEVAFSTKLRAVISEGKPTGLSFGASVLLDLLLRHIDLPVYREDFFEEYLGKSRKAADAEAFDELSQIEVLAPHLLRLQYGKNETVYGLSSRSHDTSLLTDRTLAAANYDSSKGLTAESELGKHTKLIAISALSAAGTAAAAVASVLIIRNRRGNN